MFDGFFRDLRHAVRTMRRSGAATPITIVTLSLGIGVASALFAVVHAVLLQPLVPDQSRVVLVSKADTRRGDFPVPLSLHEFGLWRDQSRSFQALAAVDHAATGPTSIAVGGTNTIARLAPVSAGFFQIAVGGMPLYGRWFDDTDEQPGADVAAVVSEGFWRRASGGDPRFIGRRLAWAGTRTLVIVGVAPAALDYPLHTDIWAPAARVFDGAHNRFNAQDRTFAQFELLGRLAPGIGIEQARTELDVIHRRVADAFPTVYHPVRVTIEPLIDAVAGSSRWMLLALGAAAALVFLVAGVNVASLLLMRASMRQHELAVQRALGAREIDVLRYTIAEALVLGLMGMAGGLLVAHGLLAVLTWLSPAQIPRLETASINIPVVAFCACIAMAWVATLGTLPVWWRRRHASPYDAHRAMRATHRTTGLGILTAAEIAAAVVVAIGAALLLRTFAHLQAIDRGFDTSHLSLLTFVLPESRQSDPQAMLALYDLVLPQVEALPGVRAASPVHVGPGSGSLGLSAPMLFEGQTPASAAANPWATWEPVLPSYFRTLGVPIVSGRAFTNDDRRETAPVAIVSESVARRYWPGQDPIGKRLRFVAGDTWPWVTVVGVAADTRYRELTHPWMTVYYPARQFFYFQPSSLAVRAVDPDAIVPAVLQRVQNIEPAASLASAASMDTLLARELARPLTAVSIATLFAALAIALAAIGVFGVMADDVRHRRRELAVRSAIGASPAEIFRAVVMRSALLAGIGTAVGLLAAAAVTRTLQSMLYDVTPLDPLAFTAGGAVLLLVVVAASCGPARTAARTDPAMTLRTE